MVRIGRRIRRNRRGEFELRLPSEEREMLRSLPGQLLALLGGGSDEPDLHRLFPPAYARDREAEAEYRGMVGSELLESHQEALRIMAATLDQPHLDEEQLTAWLTGLNELRLVLGTRLDVSEDQQPLDPGHPDAPAMALYGYLTWLQEQAVEALSEAL
ncbi:MAG TPA: DUF2017 family protein [Acidimicrobiales bacterium]|nr:DUF2017 family protein [Acidimicrobiales bacterium]